jgi:hypothetical protein
VFRLQLWYVDAAARLRSNSAERSHDKGVSGTLEPAPTDKLSLALAILYKHPDWSAARIAEEVGCAPANLSKQPKWRAAVKAIKGIGQENLRQAHRHRGHDMDEYRDDGGSQRQGRSAAVWLCSCGDPAGMDPAGELLMHEGEPRCSECWAELHKPAG